MTNVDERDLAEMRLTLHLNGGAECAAGYQLLESLGPPISSMIDNQRHRAVRFDYAFTGMRMVVEADGWREEVIVGTGVNARVEIPFEHHGKMGKVTAIFYKKSREFPIKL